MSPIFMIAGYGFWILFYLLLIRRSYFDKRSGAPMMGICLGISWEFMFSFIEPQPPEMAIGNKLWFFCDCIVLTQFLIYNKSEFPPNLPSKLFRPTFCVSLLFSFMLVYCFTYQFGDFTGRLSGYFMNLPISIWFITMLIGRDNVEGQSLYIALAKMLGTLSLNFITYKHDPESKLLAYLYVSILFFDIVYVVMVYRKCRILGISPWQRL